VSKLEKAKIPCGRVNDLEALFTGQTAQELQLVKEVGNQKYVRSPITSPQTSLQSITSPPTLNQHGNEILTELGFSPL
jgi:crotonobetainyl-CoA:carnitine CoA-transferase CaiB-like acyl-CoA transferase